MKRFYKHGLISSALVLVMYLAVLIVSTITPFGDKTFLMYDLKRQYVDFYAYLRTVYAGENSAFYSFNAALGSGTLGFFAYYLTSPFLILLSLFDKTAIPLGITMVIGLKLMLAAFIMDVFLQRFVTASDALSPLTTRSAATYFGAVSWAFSGFLFAHSMNMMWMDVVIFLPLYIWSLVLLFEESKKLPFIIVLFLMLMFNYYITYQVLMFTALWTLLRLILRKNGHPFRQIGRLVCSGTVSVLLTAVVMVPTFLELLDSPKDITLLGSEMTGINLNLMALVSKLPSLSYDYIEARFGYPQLYCGVLTLFMILLYFLSKEISISEKIGFAVFFVIFGVSFCVDILNVAWHAGMEPSGHPYRQAFLCVFLMIVCSCRGFVSMEKELSVIKLILITGIMGFFLYLLRRGYYDHFSDYTWYGNLIMIAAFAGVLLAFILLQNKRRVTVLLPVLLIMCMTDLTGNAAFTYHWQALKCESASEYRQVIGNMQTTVNAVKDLEQDNTLYRMENLNPRQQNDAFQYNYYGVTQYSSAGLVYVRYFLQRLGFNDDKLYTHYGHDNTETMDSLLGIKYVISDGTFPVHQDYELVVDGAERAYRNPYALSVATATRDFDLTSISDLQKNTPEASLTHVPDMDAFSLQEDLYGRLLGKDISLFVPASVEKSEMYLQDDKPRYDYSVTVSQDGELYFYIDGVINAEESLSVYVGDEFLTTYGNASCVKILNLGYHQAGDHLDIIVQGESVDDNFGEAVFVTEDTDALRTAFEELSENNCDVTVKPSKAQMEITAAADAEGVFLFVPFEKAWKVTVNGVKTEPVAVYDSLTYIPLAAEAVNGQYHIRMRYVSSGILGGLILTLIGLMLLVSVLLSEMKSKNTFLQKIRSYRSYIIRLAVLALCLFAVVRIVKADSASKGLADLDFMYAKAGGQKINVFEQNGEYYLFMPGYLEESDIVFSPEAKKHDIRVMRSANIATIFITTNSGSLNKIYADKEYRESGKITVVDETGTVNIRCGLDYIKGRGNYSWNNWEKKPFKIKLSKNASVLGLGIGQNYALIANASDATLIRNEIARNLEVKVGIPYAATGRFADLYINGDYMGNYYLCAGIAVGEEHIDITNLDQIQSEVFAGLNANAFQVYETPKKKGWNLPESASDITGGYLVEREFADRYKLEYASMKNGFVTDQNEHYIVHSPEYCTVNEINYISTFFNEAEKEILEGKPGSKYIDLPSFAKRYMVEEVLKNYDGGVSSAYYYKDRDAVDPKLYAGPGWDFDMSLGNYLDWMEYAKEDATGITELYLSDHNSIYYKNMLQYDGFNDLVAEYYETYALAYMTDLVQNGVDAYQKKLAASSAMDSIRWAGMYAEDGYAAGEEQAYRELKSFIEERVDFLSGAWLK